MSSWLQVLRRLAASVLPPGQPVDEQLLADVAPLLDQLGSVFGEVGIAILICTYIFNIKSPALYIPILYVATIGIRSWSYNPRFIAHPSALCICL